VAAASFLSSAAVMPNVKTATDKHRKIFMVCKQKAVTLGKEDASDSWLQYNKYFWHGGSNSSKT
jgi:hypothetical protein